METEWLTKIEDVKMLTKLSEENNLPEGVLDEILELGCFEIFKHKQDIIEYDHPCNFIRVLITGRAISYTYTEKNEYVANIYFTDGSVFIVDMPSFDSGGLSKIGIRSHGVSTFLRISKKSFHYLLNKYPELYAFMLYMTRIQLARAEKQIEALKCLNAGEKIDIYFKENPVSSMYLHEDVISSYIKAVNDDISKYRNDNKLPQDLIVDKKRK